MSTYCSLSLALLVFLPMEKIVYPKTKNGLPLADFHKNGGGFQAVLQRSGVSVLEGQGLPHWLFQLSHDQELPKNWDFQLQRWHHQTFPTCPRSGTSKELGLSATEVTSPDFSNLPTIRNFQRTGTLRYRGDITRPTDVISFQGCSCSLLQYSGCNSGIISRVPDQNGVSQAWYIVEIHHSGRKPSIYD